MTLKRVIRHAGSKAVPACMLACARATQGSVSGEGARDAPHLPVILLEVAQALPNVGVGGDVWHNVRGLQNTPT